MSYDLVIIGDVMASALNDTGMEMLKDYCEHGGNLLVLAGPYAYGDGGYRDTVLAEVLPVVCGGPFDLRAVGAEAVKNALPPEVLAPDQASALQPQYLNVVAAKPDARTLLSYGPWPLLVQGKFGQGRVYCVTAAPLGQREWWKTPQWQRVLGYVFQDMGLNRGGTGG